MGIQGRLTSLEQKRPDNKPTPWEKKALRSFKSGNEEYSELVQIENHFFLRFMRPVRLKKSCMRCHKEENKQINEIRGGVSIIVPLEDHFSLFNTHI